MSRPFLTLAKFTFLKCYFKNIGVKTPYIFPCVWRTHLVYVHCSNIPSVWSGSSQGKTLFHEMFAGVILDSLIEVKIYQTVCTVLQRAHVGLLSSIHAYCTWPFFYLTNIAFHFLPVYPVACGWLAEWGTLYDE